MNILRVNMNDGRVAYEAVPEDWKYLGGSAILAKIMIQQTPPTADPLGRKTISSLPAAPWQAHGPRRWAAFP
jgi:aldehyde:ferredoxin oxidoreductase